MFSNFLFRTSVGILFWLVIGIPLINQSCRFGDVLLGFVGLVICTLGLALIPVVPIAYITGFLLTIWFVPLAWKRLPGQEHRACANKKLDSAQIAAIRYIIRARNIGQSDAEIHEELLRCGWSADEAAAHLAAAQIN